MLIKGNLNCVLFKCDDDGMVNSKKKRNPQFSFISSMSLNILTLQNLKTSVNESLCKEILIQVKHIFNSSVKTPLSLFSNTFSISLTKDEKGYRL